MKTILTVVASMFVTLSANAANGMRSPDKAEEPRQKTATSTGKAEKNSAKKTRLSDPSKAEPALRYVILEHDCLRFTGSRLLPDESGNGKRCVIGNGRVYNREAADTTTMEILR